MTAPRYTADQMGATAAYYESPDMALPSSLVEAMPAMLRQAAETERALEAFRAWLRDNLSAPVNRVEVLLELDRRFGRTP